MSDADILFTIWLAIGFVNWLVIRQCYDWWIDKPVTVISITLLGPLLWLAWLYNLFEIWKNPTS